MIRRPRRQLRPLRPCQRLYLESLEARRVLDSTVVFNEIMYHPRDDESLEFIELYNQMAVDMDISEWYITGGVEYQFPAGTIVPSGEYMVVAKDPSGLAAATGFNTAAGPFLGQLSNDGESLELRDRNDRLMNEVDFGDGGRWPVAADGSGTSLSKVNPNTTSDAPELWSSSVLIGGTPGQRNFSNEDIPRSTSDLITLESTWRYEASDVFPGADWSTADFDDSTWGSGQPTFFAGNAGVNEVEIVEGVTANASSELVGFDRKAAYILDGSGLVNDTHGIGPDGNMWLNQGSFGGGPADLAPEITFDLGSVRAVDHIRVWNYNEQLPGRPELLNRGISSADILVAGEDENFSILIADQAFDKGSGAQTDFSQIIDLGQVQARYIKFDIHGNFPGGDNNFVGLSEIQFFAVTNTLQGELPLGASTYYYRTEFDFEGDISTADLFLDATIDDGAIVYLNGTEIYRQNMPAGNVDHETFATSPIGTPSPISDLIVPSDALVNGTNVLAVEVHQSAAGDGDMLFEATLRGLAAPRSQSNFETLDLAINETAPGTEEDVWFEVVNFGDEAIDLSGFIVGSRGNEHTLTGPTLVPGAYHRLSESDLGFNLADGDVVAVYSPDRTLVVDAAEIKNSLKGRSPDATGPFLFPDMATPGAANSFSFHDEIVINEIMYNHRPRQGSLEILPTFATSEIVAPGEVWRYNNTGEALEPGWHETSHAVGGNWAEGPGLFGYQRLDFILPQPKLGTPFVDPRSVTPPVTTFYFEKDFTLTADDLLDASHLEIEHAVDDGAVFYLNGKEIYRFGMPDGPITSDTLASQRVILTARYSDPVVIPIDELVVGTNRISVEVHQDALDSDDVVFGSRLSIARITKPGTAAVPFTEIPEEWVELYNRGTSEVELTGWEFKDGIDFEFPAGTTIAPGEYLVVSNDSSALKSKYPEIADSIVGDFSGRLNNFSDRLVLTDSQGNPADEVQYFEGGQWPTSADGNGPSLELRDPDADSSVGLAWSASDDAQRSEWQTYTYEGVAEASSIGPDNQWKEFVMGMLTDGEVLLDDISVVEDPHGAAIELIQNGSFTADTVGEEASTWRIIGNHRHSEVITDPSDPTNQVLRFVATGATEHMHNHAETTLKNGNAFVSIQNGQTYQISFRAKWVSGSGQLHTRLYFNRLARVNLIEQPELHGTPGQQNSTFEDNLGPSYGEFAHSPAVPEPNEPVTVSVVANDPDNVANLALWYAVDGGEWIETIMSASDGRFSGVIPGQDASSIVQFYVEGRDGLGAVTTFPREGRDSRALYKVQDGLASDTGLHNLRIIVTPQDADFLHSTVELMSNDYIGATVIYNESEVFYDASLRLSGSERARPLQQRLAFSLRFNPDQLFRGVHGGITLDRSESTFFGQREHLYHHGMNHAGGLPTEYSDLFHIMTPRLEHTGSTEAQLARYSDVFLDSQYENGSDGRLYEYELTYFPTTTTGGVEGRKLPQPDGVDGVGIRSQGPHREDYRWAFLNKNNRRQDDYSRLIEFTEAMGLRDDAFHDAIGEFIDIDQWLRAFAFSVLTGHGDNYGSDGAQHNLQLYVRPSDQRVLFFPHDLDAFFSATRPLVQNGDLQKLISLPQNAHMYYGHVIDMIETTFNRSYMERWTDHWGELLPAQNFDRHLSEMVSRSNFLLDEVRDRAPATDFEITTEESMVDSSNVTIMGNGWVDVREIRLAGSNIALPVEWPTVTSFAVSVPVATGENDVTLEAYNFQGELIGTDSVTIISTASNLAAEFLRISEIHFNPAAPTTAELEVNSGFNNDDFEFIEVQNIGVESINLLNISFTDGVDYRFPSVTLAPGERGVVVRDRAAFELRYGDESNILGQYSGGLSNAGENLTLASDDGTMILDFAYDDQQGWPQTADGAGASLELVAASTPLDQFGKYYQWRGSTDFGGSPGTVGSGSVGVVINEVLAHTDPPVEHSDSIELRNTSSVDIDISGWYLSDDGDNLLKFEIPAGTILSPGEYVVFDEDDFNPSMGVDPELHPLDFALSGTSGDEVFLVIADDDGAVRQFADAVQFGASPNGESFGRITSAEQLAPMQSPTLGEANSEPRVGPILISEVHYHPAAPSPAALAADPTVSVDDLEFVEIHNPTTSNVDLTGWRLRGGVDFDFADAYSLLAGQTLVVVPFNPDDVQNAQRLAAFRAQYSIGENVTIVGGYAGRLNDTGERIVLQRPDSPTPEQPTLTPPLSEDEVFYDNLSPWDTSAAGGGNSLTRASATAYGNLSGSWAGRSPSPGVAQFSLPGDITGDGLVNVDDINALFAAIADGNPDEQLDLDGDNNIDQSDVVFLVENLIGTVVGDANLDGKVDAADLNRVGLNWQTEGGVGWEQGDFNGDGRVDAADLNQVGVNWLRTAAAATHPVARVPRAALAAVRVNPVHEQHVDAVFSEDGLTNRLRKRYDRAGRIGPATSR